jgi:hypothetical protein
MVDLSLAEFMAAELRGSLADAFAAGREEGFTAGVKLATEAKEVR